MQRLSKRRGVISVFLLIIFMVTYVFMGLLVDAARFRMAGAYLEAALDQAGDSVLSNYNQLIFDLYGLFAVETDAKDKEAMEAKIKELYNHYLEETLGLADVDVEEYKTVLNTIFAGIKGEEDPNSSTKQLYDFKIENLNSGTKVTLADPANVESQIIEYMKFRAPVDLIDGMSGFLQKIKGLLDVKDRVSDAIEKTTITKKYETGGENSLSSQAFNLQADINKFAVKLYKYSCEPRKEPNSFGAADPGEMMDRNQIYEGNPFSLNILIQEFDQKIKEATKKYLDDIQNMEDKYAEKLFELLNLFRSKLKNDHNHKEIVVSKNYKKEDDDGQTKNFTEIDFDRDELTVKVTIDLAEDLYQALSSKTEEDRTEYEEDFITEYKVEKDSYENGRLKEEIEGELKEAHITAKKVLVDNCKNIEANAEGLYEETLVLRDRLETVIHRYDSYIAELQAKLDEGGESKKTVYAPEIELAKGNAGELLKNVDLLLNCRPYLINICYGYFESHDKLSRWMGGQADQIISDREKFYIAEGKSEGSGTLGNTPLASMVDLGTSYTNGNASKDLYITPYTEAVGELVPLEQGDICTLYSHASYFQTCHYRRDVDVNTGKSVSEKEVKTDKAAEDASKGEEKESGEGKKPLDNEGMLKDGDYLKYLTVNYQHSEHVIEAEDTNSEVSVDGKVDLDSMLNILDIGKMLIEKLEELLESARDNLYIDVYVMSMLPNYYDYLKMNADKLGDDFPTAFQKEYENYTASYASVEYIITGAGGGKDKVFSEEVKAGENGNPGVGFGEISVRKMRTKLFGTRMLFNCISMFTDSAKYSQASSLAACAGPFAPLVTVVLMVAWAAGESVLDVFVLLGEGIGPQLNADGQVALLKQGKDWFFSIEGAVSGLVNGIIDEVEEGIKDKATNLTKTLETKVNGMIYDAYSSTKGTVDQVLGDAKESWTNGINDWTNELKENIQSNDILENAIVGEDGNKLQVLQDGLNAAQQTVNNLSNTITTQTNEIFDKAQQGANKFLGDVKERAVTAVSRASEELLEKANSTIDNAGDKAKEFLKNNLNKVIPVGEVVHSGSSEESGVKMGYKEYLYFYLFFMNNEMKIKRIQSVLQANMWVGGRKDFLMETSPASVWADLECSLKYFFLSNGLVPESMRRDGRLRQKVISGQTY